ncbi:MAG TPA: phenylalanine--tRNA ligase subunit beta [Candidatus Moranbacteria bacterium]|nr:phenylalanine--tRNA ligase subunit beta [Candidatus Moranbacteria bacterium]
MKYSYNWLKELSGTKKMPEKVMEDLTFHSFEVEGLEKGEINIPGVIVGKILEIKKHPNADKLQLLKVDVGAGSALNIVCGAWNIKAGDKVPVALVDTNLSNGMKIKEAEIRGEKSFGMLCAEDELGLGKNHEGILILPESAKIGDPISKYFRSKDSVIEIKVLPDRSHDAMSYVGVAREIAVLERKKFDYDFDGLVLPKKKSKKLKIAVKSSKLCPRYIGAVMENIKIKESPDWMKKRLEASGIRAINNVVDATNYVMLELGNPLHAFDVDKLKVQSEKLKVTVQNSKLGIVVRKAKTGEKIKLLDGVVKELTSDDLLITDGDNPLAIAGIKGGKLAEIDGNTKNIVLESANFNAVSIRKTRTRLNLKTDSSDRFEKDIDPNLAEKAMARLIEIIEHTAGGKLTGVVDVYSKKVAPWKIKLDSSYVNSLLGEFILVKDMTRILNILGIKTKNGKIIECIVPTYRFDLKTQEDLIEEIGRIWGYEKVKEQPMISEILPAKINEQVFFERKVQDKLTGIGFDEVYNYSFYGEKDMVSCGFDNIKHLELENPMNSEQKYVRTSLIPNILKNIYENLKNFEDFRVFEEGRCYRPDGKKVEEKRMLAMAVAKNKDSKGEIFYDLKGAIEDMLEGFGVNSYEVRLRKNPEKICHPFRSAEIKIAGEKIGVLSEINPAVLSAYKIKSPVAVAEFDLEILKKHANKSKIYNPISKYPVVTRDISLLVSNDTTYAQIVDTIKKIGKNLVKNIKLFDVFEKDSQKSLAFRIEFEDKKKTFEKAEVERSIEKIVSTLEAELGVTVRK